MDEGVSIDRIAVGQHTFLFTDLVGYTALTAERGDEYGAEIAHDFYRRVRPLLAAHGAVEIKTIGDGLMLRADEARSALRLGLAIVAAVESLDGFPPVRVGLHTGPAVARDGDWYGTTVNVAARLCAAAAGGEVLASETACDVAGRLRGVAIGERRLHWLKNVTEPVCARPVAAARSRRLGIRVRMRGRELGRDVCGGLFATPQGVRP